MSKVGKIVAADLYFRAVKRIFLPFHYLNYLLRAKTLHGTHSAFVYEFYQKVIEGDLQYYDFAPIEHLRSMLLQSDEVIQVVDFGAGTGGNRKVKDIAAKSSIPSKQGRLLFRLVNFIQPKVMLEMGTSLGISTLYQAKACPDANFTTMEGSPQTAQLAAKNFKLLKANNIKQVTGNFDETLPQVLKTFSSLDYVLFDGNHRKEPTLNYFKQCLPLASDNCVFVFDDIRWSDGMYRAWQEIIKEPSATVTIDLFSFGLVFFRKAQVKEHFTLRF
ncbi:MAG TPA: class I SAM-dependent methyltransferase [Bacteroidia bacterium]|nr:class I SAM-dependent methyltransferase [Bacteroidia bacterium]